VRGKSLNYVMVAGAAVVAGLLIAGTPVRSLLSFVLLLACPLMMLFMMRGMGGHGDGGGHGCGHGRTEADESRSPGESVPGQDR
jgi:DUF2933 family protein